MTEHLENDPINRSFKGSMMTSCSVDMDKN